MPRRNPDVRDRPFPNGCPRPWLLLQHICSQSTSDCGGAKGWHHTIRMWQIYYCHDGMPAAPLHPWRWLRLGNARNGRRLEFLSPRPAAIQQQRRRITQTKDDTPFVLLNAERGSSTIGRVKSPTRNRIRQLIHGASKRTATFEPGAPAFLSCFGCDSG